MLKDLWELVKNLGDVFIKRFEEKEKVNYSTKNGSFALIQRTTALMDIKVTSGSLKIAILSDIHSPYFYPPAVSLAFRITKDAKPSLIILNGDIIDFYSISPHKKANRQNRIREEIEITRQLLNLWLKAFRNIPFIYLEANHERFLQRYIATHADLLLPLEDLEVPSLLRFKGKDRYYLYTDMEYGTYTTTSYPLVRFLDKNERPVLYVAHGDGFPVDRRTKYVAKSILERSQVSIICGHWHTHQRWSFTTLDGRPLNCWILPALSFPRAHWKHEVWTLGMGIVEINEKGDFAVDVIEFTPDVQSLRLVAFWRGKRYEETIDDKGLIFPSMFAQQKSEDVENLPTNSKRKS